MKNHQLFTSEFTVPLCDIIDGRVADEKLRELVMHVLTTDLVDAVVKTPGLSVLSSTDDRLSGGYLYRLSIMVINPTKYKELERIIEQTDLRIYDEKYGTIYLKDLL